MTYKFDYEYCTPDQARKLFDLGLDLPTHMTWMRSYGDDVPSDPYRLKPACPGFPIKLNKNIKHSVINLPAYPELQLDIILPFLVYFPVDKAGKLAGYRNDTELVYGYFEDWDLSKPLLVDSSKFGAKAKAELLIRMIRDEKLINVEKLNTLT